MIFFSFFKVLDFFLSSEALFLNLFFLKKKKKKSDDMVGKSLCYSRNWNYLLGKKWNNGNAMVSSWSLI